MPWATSAALAWLLAPGSGPQPDGWLTWDAPEPCPGGEAVARGVQERLGRLPQPDELAVKASIVDGGASGFEVTLQIEREGVTESRGLVAHDCRALADATALLVALAVDAVSVAERVEVDDRGGLVEPATELPTVVAPVGADVAAAEDRAAPRSASAFQGGDMAQPTSRRHRVDASPTDFNLYGGGGLELGALPGVSGGPVLGTSLGWRRISLGVSGRYVAPRTTSSGATIRVQLGAAAARGCFRFAQGQPRLDVPLCVGLEVGGMRGDGRGVDGSTGGVEVWLAPLGTCPRKGLALSDVPGRQPRNSSSGTRCDLIGG